MALLAFILQMQIILLLAALLLFLIKTLWLPIHIAKIDVTSCRMSLYHRPESMLDLCKGPAQLAMIYYSASR